MGTELIPLVFTSGWASGINAYAALLVLGLAERFFGFSQIPDALGRTDVLVGAGILFVIEMVADKIPYVDSLWDSIHTVVRPAVGATIGYLLGHDNAALATAASAATGGVTAFISHTVKAGLRAAVNTSPEPASNIVVSTGEDLTVTGVMALAVAHPWWAAGIAFVLLAAGAYLLYRLAGRLRRVKRRYDAWGERVGIATPAGRSRRARGPRGSRAAPPAGPEPDPAVEQPSDQPFDQER
ncbi:hypothetical protein BA895_21320 [Humibacillus sp. DSM 29435]|uniref:DUF4126 domain-containing protein n=1 Tax=Humibacillus sp. DSM 29435 TaxID=1869167 RepID=UPI0008721EBA|nr:DUF4126 domain-containing protein [Humibacillus sp. DSM 29435]OFE15761.1 hypothetical protein BA895_21320 [Humibacillus sp. DSM 29435]